MSEKEKDHSETDETKETDKDVDRRSGTGTEEHDRKGAG